MVATQHVETARVPGMRLGKRPRDASRPVLKLSDYLTGAVPDHPPAVDYFTRVKQWILGGNDRFGTCGPVSLANLLLLVSTCIGDAPVRSSDADIFDLYRRSGNPGFDPSTGADDNGVEMTVMLSAALKGGIGGRKPLAFAAVNGSNPDEVWAAGALFGGTVWGADLDIAQQSQTGSGLWDYTTGSGQWGGHAVLAAGRYSDQPGTAADRTGLITWGQVLDSTDQFITRQVFERYVVIFPEHLGSRTFLTGVDLAKLAKDYEALTGRVFPAPVPPADPDKVLASKVRPWVTQPHTGSNRRAAQAVAAWLQAKNL